MVAKTGEWEKGREMIFPLLPNSLPIKTKNQDWPFDGTGINVTGLW